MTKLFLQTEIMTSTTSTPSSSRQIPSWTLEDLENILNQDPLHLSQILSDMDPEIHVSKTSCSISFVKNKEDEPITATKVSTTVSLSYSGHYPSSSDDEFIVNDGEISIPPSPSQLNLDDYPYPQPEPYVYTGEHTTPNYTGVVLEVQAGNDQDTPTSSSDFETSEDEQTHAQSPLPLTPPFTPQQTQQQKNYTDKLREKFQSSLARKQQRKQQWKKNFTCNNTEDHEDDNMDACFCKKCRWSNTNRISKQKTVEERRRASLSDNNNNNNNSSDDMYKPKNTFINSLTLFTGLSFSTTFEQGNWRYFLKPILTLCSSSKFCDFMEKFCMEETHSTADCVVKVIEWLDFDDYNKVNFFNTLDNFLATHNQSGSVEPATLAKLESLRTLLAPLNTPKIAQLRSTFLNPVANFLASSSSNTNCILSSME